MVGEMGSERRGDDGAVARHSGRRKEVDAEDK